MRVKTPSGAFFLKTQQVVIFLGNGWIFISLRYFFHLVPILLYVHPFVFSFLRFTTYHISKFYDYCRQIFQSDPKRKHVKSGSYCHSFMGHHSSTPPRLMSHPKQTNIVDNGLKTPLTVIRFTEELYRLNHMSRLFLSLLCTLLCVH